MLSGPLKALLGVLAVAGYQNRDKIGELLKNLQSGSTASAGDKGAAAQTGQAQSGGLGDLLGGLTSGGILGGGLKDLVERLAERAWRKSGIMGSARRKCRYRRQRAF